MRYVLTALAAAVVAFLAASLIIREQPVSKKGRGATLAERFPEQAETYRHPAGEDARWKEKRGHAFSLKERDETAPGDDPRWNRILAGRPKERPLPARCLTCHAAASGGKPIGCEDCHDPHTAALRLTRNAPRAPGNYDDLRTLVCTQCHHNPGGADPLVRSRPPGRLAESQQEWAGQGAGRGPGGPPHHWTHTETGAEVIEARHPQYEMYSQGIHARAGAACTDCHMPAYRRGPARLTDHNARSPLDNLQRACLPCHRSTAEEMRARVDAIQQRTASLLSRGEDALIEAIDAIETAQASGAHPDAALKLQTQAQWRLEFVAADRSKGFHAPQEAARLLAEAIDYARQAQLEAMRTGGRMKVSYGIP
jgi:formate-dependent nitrite reductase cytochrome c552 subunit